MEEEKRLVDWKTLDRLNEDEIRFWNDFILEADMLIHKKRMEGSASPWEPTDSLKNKYARAVEKYNGGKYVEVCRIKELFAL